MRQPSFLGDLLTTLFERRRAPADSRDPRPIEAMCRALLSSEGMVSGIQLSKAILSRYAQLDRGSKRAFFDFLNDELELDPKAIAQLATAYARTPDVAVYRRLTAAAEPPRQELLRRLNQSTGATGELVRMRVDLLDLLKEAPQLKRTDLDFVHLLRSWFNRGFLVLRPINWETSASILEKIVAYEAVHAIDDWDDLRRRLYPPDRRCFAYFHPTMPDEPLIFVEVALTDGIAGSIQQVLAEDRTPLAPQQMTTAVFYSISNCQKGLKGVSFGNLLIKQVVAELSAELPQLDTFVTLSPMPGFSRWLAQNDRLPRAARVLTGTATDEEVEAMAAYYLLHARTDDGEPLDPVARFHLGNGAQIHAVHADADTTPNGRRQSCGAMVNYFYDLARIEANHAGLVLKGEIAADKALRLKASAPENFPQEDAI